jgi:hypothetical protein
MHGASVKDEEKSFLRMLYLHASGSKSFADMKTVIGLLYLTLKKRLFIDNCLYLMMNGIKHWKKQQTFQMPM